MFRRTEPVGAGALQIVDRDGFGGVVRGRVVPSVPGHGALDGMVIGSVRVDQCAVSGGLCVVAEIGEHQREIEVRGEVFRLRGEHALELAARVVEQAATLHGLCGATQLARTESCEQQAFRYGDKAYGVQFHPEVDQPLIERWLGTPAYREEVCAAGLEHDADAIREHSETHAPLLGERAEPLFNAFLDLIGRPARRLVLPSR